MTGTATGHGRRTAVLTGIAMLAFAGNSIICRLALRDAAIDPAGFTLLRLMSGATVLWMIVTLRKRESAIRRGSWRSACALFAYAIAFSYAYVSLSAGAGALILFGAVQATMISAGLFGGARPAAPEWLGWAIAVAGLAWLLLPGSTAPSAPGALLMALAGAAWGYYSIRGRTESEPLAATAGNFVRSLAAIVLLVPLALADLRITLPGAALAVLSGGLTSGVGYVIWYAALEGLSAMQGALVQLSVPVIATTGGVILLAEPLTPRLVIATGLVLGGIALALVRRSS